MENKIQVVDISRSSSMGISRPRLIKSVIKADESLTDGMIKFAKTHSQEWRKNNAIIHGGYIETFIQHSDYPATRV